jgi:hypothetical protein
MKSACPATVILLALANRRRKSLTRSPLVAGETVGVGCPAVLLIDSKDCIEA